MNFFKKLFQNKKKETTPMPSWSDIVEIMYDKGLDSFSDEVVCVIYSTDKAKRYVVLKDTKGLFKYQLEAIYQFDEDEWKNLCSKKDAFPAIWEPFRGNVGKSFFEAKDELLKEMKQEPEYKQYFN